MGRRGVYWILVLLICSSAVQAQNHNRRNTYKPAASQDAFTKTQFYLGIRSGFSLTSAHVKQRYSSFVSPSDPNQTYDKTYQSYDQAAALAGLDFAFYFKGFTLSFQPNYRRERFNYSNQYQWTDNSDPSNYLELRYKQDVRLDYLELPLFVKYDIIQTNLRPFVQVGFYYGMLNSATRHLVVSGTDHASGTSRDFIQQDAIVGAKELYIRSSTGIAFGAGCSYKLGNVRLVADVTYRYGFNNTTNVSNRYSSNPLSGSGDVPDDLSLNNISFSFGCLFPMKFLTSGKYKAVD